MRVLLVSQRFPPDGVGGVERYTETLAAELVKSGDSVSILARRPESTQQVRMVRERLRDGSHIYRVMAGHVNLERCLDRHERLEQLFTTAMLEANPQIVHLNHLMGMSPRFVPIARRLGAAVVLSLHDFYISCPRVHLQKPNGDLCAGPDHGRECSRTCFPANSGDGPLRWGMRNLYFQAVLSMADVIVAYSEHIASYFRNVLTDSRSVHVIPNGVPAELLSARRPESGIERRDPLRIAYCGTVSAHKGPHIILEALRVAALPSATLIVAGNIPQSSYRNRLREAAAAIPGLNLRLYGNYERRELAILLQDTDCLVVPSLVPEAGPIVPREALALGVPVIAARLGALPELIVEGENGFTFRQAAELAGILQRLQKDPALRLRLRQGAQRSAVVTVSEHAGHIRAIYAEALRLVQSSKRAETEQVQFNLIHQAMLNLGFDSAVTR